MTQVTQGHRMRIKLAKNNLQISLANYCPTRNPYLTFYNVISLPQSASLCASYDSCIFFFFSERVKKNYNPILNSFHLFFFSFYYLIYAYRWFTNEVCSNNDAAIFWYLMTTVSTNNKTNQSPPKMLCRVFVENELFQSQRVISPASICPYCLKWVSVKFIVRRLGCSHKEQCWRNQNIFCICNARRFYLRSRVQW